MIAEAKKLPDVISAGWAGYSNMNAALRLPASKWTSAGTFNRDMLAAQLGKSLAQALDATLTASSWNPATGELVIGLERTSQFFPNLGFTDEIEVNILAEFEAPGATENLVVWINEVKGAVADKGAGARLR